MMLHGRFQDLQCQKEPIFSFLRALGVFAVNIPAFLYEQR
jgi:hypothetical protein